MTRILYIFRGIVPPRPDTERTSSHIGLRLLRVRCCCRFRSRVSEAGSTICVLYLDGSPTASSKDMARHQALTSKKQS
jgi:hypothetical protein